MTSEPPTVLNYAPPARDTTRLRKSVRIFGKSLLLVGVVLAASVTAYFLQPARYTAVGSLRFTPIAGVESTLDADPVRTANALCSNEKLAQAISYAMESEARFWTVEEYRSKLDVRVVPGSNSILVRCTDKTPLAAAVGIQIMIQEAIIASHGQWLGTQSTTSPKVPERTPMWALVGGVVSIFCLVCWRACRMRTATR